MNSNQLTQERIVKLRVALWKESYYLKLQLGGLTQDLQRRINEILEVLEADEIAETKIMKLRIIETKEPDAEWWCPFHDELDQNAKCICFEKVKEGEGK